MTDLTPRGIPYFLDGPHDDTPSIEPATSLVETLRQRKHEGLLGLARGLFRRAGISKEVVAEMSDEELMEGFENYKTNVLREAHEERQEEQREAVILDAAEQLLTDLATGADQHAALAMFMARTDTDKEPQDAE